MGQFQGLPRLGVNIDHIATIRELRHTPYPNLMEAGRIVREAGADQITIHLREDRRHIQDRDVKDFCQDRPLPINLELALSDPIIRMACRLKPDWACFVPEKRQELTTEGGLDVKKKRRKLAPAIEKCQKKGIRVSLFIEPTKVAVRQSHELGAEAVELHTGKYCLARQGAFGKRSPHVAKKELEKIREAAELARDLKIGAHAGHGFDYENLRTVVDLNLIEEYNIGHAIIARAVFVGLERAVREMKSLILAP